MVTVLELLPKAGSKVVELTVNVSVTALPDNTVVRIAMDRVPLRGNDAAVQVTLRATAS